MSAYVFEEPLTKGRIVNRPNRFIANVEVNGEIFKAHCPVSGRIGGLTLDGLPCLVSGPYEGRGTTHTLEAFALEEESSESFQWIGINQTRCNRVVEEHLKANALSKVFPVSAPSDVRREKNLGNSRIDFLLHDDTFIEVKMPLLKVHALRPDSVPIKEFKAGDPSDRLPKQMRAMVEAIESGYRGAMLVCFQYENALGTSSKLQLEENIFPDEALLAAKNAGLEQWVASFRLTPEAISLTSLKQV